jgi:WD40 repeat protein
MTERELREALRRAGGSDPAARERAWRVVRAAYAEHVPARRRRPWGLAAAAALALAAGGVGAAAASAPDSGVGGWVRDVLGVGTDADRLPALGSLPGGGRLLAQAGGSTWLVSSDGSRRRLGSYAGASWSPRGRFVVAWRRGMLSAVTPEGDVRWSVSRPARIAVARWGPVDGFRVAYVAGSELRVVNGDGTGDRALAATLAGVAPAWRPGASRLLSFADRRGRVALVHVDSGERVWRTAPLDEPRALAWSSGGGRLLAAGSGGLVLLDARGRRLASRALPAGSVVSDPVWSPDGRHVAAVRRDERSGRSEVLLLDPSRGLRPTVLFAGPGRFGTPAWSPDGRTLLVPWPAADQWLYLRPSGDARVTAATAIAAQFSPGRAGPRFADAVSWCCARP